MYKRVVYEEESDSDLEENQPETPLVEEKIAEQNDSLEQQQQQQQ